MKRRAFIALLGGAAFPPSYLGRSPGGAGKPASCRSFGFSRGLACYMGPLLVLLQRGCANSGWIEGRTVAIEYRWAEDASSAYLRNLAEFVRLKVDCHVTSGGQSSRQSSRHGHTHRLRLATDPVGLGFRRKSARRRECHGLRSQSTDTAGKRLELLRELVPGLRRLAIMANIGYPGAVLEDG